MPELIAALRVPPFPLRRARRRAISVRHDGHVYPWPADRIAGRLGIARTAMIRAQAGISYALAEATDEGHGGLPRDEVHTRWRPQLRDADDELVLEAAINGRADALVTYNVRDFREAALRFGLRIARPAGLLKELV